MFGLSRRSALTSSKCMASRLHAGVAKPSSRLIAREFHSTQPNAESQPTWMPMRVKTPWIDALKKQREEAKSQKAPTSTAEPDLTPKKMSDSYYSAVSSKYCINLSYS